MEGFDFVSPSLGKVSFEELSKRLSLFVEEEGGVPYKIVIGTDSERMGADGQVDFVTAVVLYRVGKGGIYFWRRFEKGGIHSLRQRIYEEAFYSMDAAEKLLNYISSNGDRKKEKEESGHFRSSEGDLRRRGNDGNGHGLLSENLEIHVDIGPNGETREMISEVVGMVRGSGFLVKTKPESYGASNVADRHT
jgi:hypothetical protein